jgi:hypothetical protein
MKKSLLASLAIGTALALAAGSPTDAEAAKAPKPKAEPAKPAGEVVEYASLENRVGQTLAIETTFKTTRTGKLIKYTQPALTLDIGKDDQPLEFTVPRETIKTITVLTPAAEPAKDTGTSGAKKN